MPKCGKCTKYPIVMADKECAKYWATGEPPGLQDDTEGCPCFHPAGEPTEGEMLDKAIELLKEKEAQLDSIARHFDARFTDYDWPARIEWSRSAIREAMKGERP